MGDFKVRQIRDARDRANMYHSVIDDLRAFEQMLAQGLIDKSHPKIGAEQELCLVDKNYNPAVSALDILDEIEEDRYTNELALFNLEVNLDPISLGGNCFRKTEEHLLEMLKTGYAHASSKDIQLLLTGILPTIKQRHLEFKYMTPILRYETLSKVLSEIRGDDFQIYLQGVDDFIRSLGSVLFEACNTSFQLHLQINPDTFVEQYNWSQMIAGPVLSACVNSPLVLGKELWAESRIAIFKQSLDTRSSKNHLRKKLPRVFFGDNWLQDGPADLWKETVMRFPLLVTSDDFENGTEVLKKGGIPDLRAVRLHNGTTYTWNRLCYGKGKIPHIRIECRYLPSGPSPVDEIANFVFWIGLMCAMPTDWNQRWPKQDFRVVKDNFMKAARYGLHSVLNWNGTNYSAKTLLLDHLIPLAKEGLKKFSIDKADIDYYLGIIAGRVEKEQTGSDWIIRNYRKLKNKYNSAMALQLLTKGMIDLQKDNQPVHLWADLQEEGTQHKPIPQQEILAEQLMSSDLITLSEEADISLARQFFQWKNIHHLPVENAKGELIGMLTDGILSRISKEKKEKPLFVKEIMIKEVISIEAQETVQKAKQILDRHKLSGLPVIYQKKLVGMLTLNDLKN